MPWRHDEEELERGGAAEPEDDVGAARVLLDESYHCI